MRELLLNASVMVHLGLADTRDKITKSRFEVFLRNEHIDVFGSGHLGQIVLWSQGVRVNRINRTCIEHGYVKGVSWW